MTFAAAAAWGQDSQDPVKLRTGLFVCIALDTAQRREAILKLTWERIDLKNELIDFTDPRHAPKNKRRCDAMPIMPRLMNVLNRAALTARKNPAGEPTGLVFPTHRLWEGFVAFRDAAGLPAWFTPHTCRHTWVTLAMGTQMPLQTISDMTGDSVATLQKTYTHVNTNTHRENLRRFLYHTQSRNQPSGTVHPEEPR
jgi:integrase